jgi:DNA-directed RNA polymerase subunit RPC12/RpoP
MRMENLERIMKCPGQDSRYWGPEAIYESSCPDCGAPIEFFKDESSRKCRKCGTKILNPKMDFGCAAYCRFAAQCLGTDMPPELLAKRTDLLKDRVAAEVKKYLGRDFKRIGRALKVVEYAGKIQRSEGGDPAIVTLAAFLSAVAGGVSTALNVSVRQLSAEDITAAQSILMRAGASEELTREVLAILKSLDAKSLADGNNFKCVYDAIRIADLAAAFKAQSPQAGNSAMDEPLLTQTGKNMMKEIVDQSTIRS